MSLCGSSSSTIARIIIAYIKVSNIVVVNIETGNAAGRSASTRSIVRMTIVIIRVATERGAACRDGVGAGRHVEIVRPRPGEFNFFEGMGDDCFQCG